MRIKTALRLLLPCLLAVLWPSLALASASHPAQPQSLRIHSDLDGDQLPDTALVRQHGDYYSLSIRSSSSRTWTRFRGYHSTEPVIGILVMDVDGDSDRDIVLLGFNRFRPSGLLLNEGAKGFRPAHPWFAADLQKRTGSSLIRFAGAGSDDEPCNVDDSGPEALVPHHVLPCIINVQSGLSREFREVAFGCQSATATLRGPPLPL